MSQRSSRRIGDREKLPIPPVDIRTLQQLEEAKMRRSAIEKRNQARSVTRMDRFEKIRKKLQPS